MKIQCENCGYEFLQESELAHVYPDIPGLLERIAPGERVPIGECPKCGALVHHSSDRLKCRICEEFVPQGTIREHLRLHNPNVDSMEWDAVRNSYHVAPDDSDEPSNPDAPQQGFRELGCPRCGDSTCIAQIDLIPGYAKIQGIYDDGSIEWLGDTNVDWNRQRPEKSPPEYICLTCSTVFTAKELGVKP